MPDAPGRGPIVVIPVHNDFASRMLAGHVALGAHRQSPLQADVPNLRIRRHEIRDIVGAIVHDDELFPRIILSPKAPDRFRKEAATVAGREDGAY